MSRNYFCVFAFNAYARLGTPPTVNGVLPRALLVLSGRIYLNKNALASNEDKGILFCSL